MDDKLTFAEFESKYHELVIQYSYAIGCKYNSALEDLYETYSKAEEDFNHETIREMIKSLYKE